MPVWVSHVITHLDFLQPSKKSFLLQQRFFIEGPYHDHMLSYSHKASSSLCMEPFLVEHTECSRLFYGVQEESWRMANECFQYPNSKKVIGRTFKKCGKDFESERWGRGEPFLATLFHKKIFYKDLIYLFPPLSTSPFWCFTSCFLVPFIKYRILKFSTLKVNPEVKPT